MLRGTLRWVLKKIVQLTVRRYRPGIIGVTGSVGKTSTILAIAAVLAPGRTIRTSADNLNSEFGLPSAIIGDWPRGNLFFRLSLIISGISQLFFKKTDYPEILILEYGAHKPEDLKELLEIARPNISVITAVGDIPAHLESFSGPEEIAKEKAKLIEYLPSAGFAILNYDDETVMNLKDRTRGHLITFGFEKGAEIRITNFEHRIENSRPVGVAFKLEYAGGVVSVRLDNVFGRVQAYAAAAAAAVGLIFGVNLVKISENLKNYKPAPGRMELLSGIKSSLILDSSYDASPLSMHAGLDTLKALPGKRKVAVLGDILGIGEYAVEAHERLGRLAGQFIDILITVGPRAKFIAEAARKKGLAKRNIHSFETTDEALETIQNLIKKDDLILITGSREMKLDKVVQGLKAAFV